MKLLSCLFLLTTATVFGQQHEYRTFRFSSAEMSRWLVSSTQTPADTRPRFHIWLRASDESVKGFRVTIRYKSGESIYAVTKVVENDHTNGALVQIPLPDDSAVVIGVTRGILREQESAELPIS